MSLKFFICPVCGNMIALIKGNSASLVCCGESMKEIIPGTVDAAKERHVPVFKRVGNKITVKIGELEHPMTSGHYIEWVYLQTNKGCQGKILKPGDKPEVSFWVCDSEEIVRVMAFCNLHGLWKS